METVANNYNFNYNRPSTSIEPRDRRVFVTEFNERDEEKVIENINDKDLGSKFKPRQLQQTVLLKYKLHEEEVNNNLREKRFSFQKNVKECKQKQEDLIRKQQENENRAKLFEKFIEEKNQKRKKAMMKYQNELKTKLQKILELDILLTEFEVLNERHLQLQLKLENRKKFRDYMTKVIDLLPENYLESAGDSKFMSLISRYQTLEETNQMLFDGLNGHADNLKELRREYENLNRQHSFTKISISSTLSELQKIKNQMEANNDQAEYDLLQNEENSRDEMLRLADLLKGIDSLAKNCETKFSVQVKDIKGFSGKLDLIKDFFIEKSLILKMVKENMTDEEYEEALMRNIED